MVYFLLFFACNLRRCLFSLLGSGGIHWALVTSSNRPLGGEGGASCPSVHISLALCHSALPSPTLTWALPLAERWDSFTEAAGCQERASPRKAGQMYVGHCESEGGFSFSYSLLFSPPFCSRVLFCLFLSLWLAPSTLMSEKITLICVSPVYYSPGLAAKTRPNKIWNLVLLTY